MVLENNDTLTTPTYDDLAKAKGEAPVTKLIIYFEKLFCNHCKETSLR